MSEFAQASHSMRLKSHADQGKLCRRIVNFTSVFFVPAVVARRVIGTPAPRGFNGAKLTIFSEARANASAVVPFIFMG